MLNNASQIIDFKNRVWQNKDVVSWYSMRMTQNTGTNLFTNEIETSLIKKYVSGKIVLDVGIGTGRATEKLLSENRAIHGVDISQAMLDVCNQKFGDRVRLQLASASSLPFKDNSFDNVISLNLVTHFPNWEDILREWSRVLTPNGSMVFDVYSKDHVLAVSDVFGTDYVKANSGFECSDPGRFNLYVSVSELNAWARSCGLSLVNIIPYGASIASTLNMFVRASLLDKARYDAVFGSLESDSEFFDWLVFLERELISSLHPSSSGKMIVVIENKKSSKDWEWSESGLRHFLDSKAFEVPAAKILTNRNVYNYIKFMSSELLRSGKLALISDFLTSAGSELLADYLKFVARQP